MLERHSNQVGFVLTGEQLLELRKRRFLAEGNIEGLVEEGLTPFNGPKELHGETVYRRLFYIPPDGYSDRDGNEAEKSFSSFSGICIFKFKDGRRKVAQSILLSQEEAHEVNRRIVEVKNRRLQL
ncbi:MAG: hypothetical protein A2152_04085 [Candidatus Levybacteria bacterium RBG_16_35_6]|nr:MAG: hypothetical protein A2152_04085 [Candidatus Levybacteria bacterium RBG_16_35_6]